MTLAPPKQKKTFEVNAILSSFCLLACVSLLMIYAELLYREALSMRSKGAIVDQEKQAILSEPITEESLLRTMG